MMDWSKYYPANYSAITAADVKMIRELKDAPVEEDNTNDVSDDGKEMDKVQPKALKKKFGNRKDKDIDNDGDTDDSDEVIHAKRKAIGKAIDKQDEAIDPAIAQAKAREAAYKKNLQHQQGGIRKVNVTTNIPAHDAAQARKERDEGVEIDEVDSSGIDMYDNKRKEAERAKKARETPSSPETKRKLKIVRAGGTVDEKQLDQKKGKNKKDYRDDNLKKTIKGIDEPDFSKNQDTVTNMEWAKKVINDYLNIEEHCGWCDQGAQTESKELPTSKGIAQQIKELAKAVRGKDRLSIEGAASLVSKKDYAKLAPYLDKMSEDARQSVLMVLMTDQKVANSVMKKMKTEQYDECFIPSHKFILEGMYKKYHELTWGEIGERLIKNTERRLVSLAYATKMGTIDAPSPEVQKLADECELEDLEKACGQMITDDSDITEVTQMTQSQKQSMQLKKDLNKKRLAQTNAASATQASSDQTRTNTATNADKDQQKRMDAEAKARAQKKAAQARLSDDPTMKKDVQTSTKGKVLGAIGTALIGSNEPEGQQIEDQKLDARRRIFKEKIKKLAYEKAKEILGKRLSVEPIITRETNKNDKSDDGEGLDAVQPDAVKKKFKDRKDKDIDNDGDKDDSDKFIHKKRKAISKSVKAEVEDSAKVKEGGNIDNKIKMDPEDKMKESTGVAFVRKFKNKMNEVNKEEGNSLQDQILELFRSSFASTDGEPVGAEFAVSDEPASASTIARTLRCSPTEVQKLLDDMVDAGQISRVGDAYSYASPRPAEPKGTKDYSAA
jgi:hypothetical protein